MTRTAVYARISQDRDGTTLGVNRQIEDCRRLVKDRGWTVTQEFTDNDISAYRSKSRPGFTAMLEAIGRREFDAVVTYHQDRLTRSPAEFEQFLSICETSGVGMFATPSGDTDIGQGDGIMVARIMAVVAANQSDSQSRRVRRKNDERAAAGLPHKTGQRAYGYEADRVTINEAEAQIIRDCASRYIAGESLVSIAEWLGGNGVRTVTGMNAWRTPTLRNLLKSPRIAGLREHRGEVVGPAIWPAIITVQQHEQIAARMKEAAATHQRSPRRYLLSGRVFCGACGTKMFSAPDSGRRRYGCRKGVDFGGGCGKVYINAEPLEALIVRAVLARLDNPSVLEVANTVTADDDEAAGLTKELDAIAQQEDELESAYTSRELPMKNYISLQRKLTQRREDAKRRLSRITAGTGLAEFAGQGSTLAALWTAEDMTLQRQAAIVTTILDRVIVHPTTTHSGPRMNPDRVEPRWLV